MKLCSILFSLIALSFAVGCTPLTPIPLDIPSATPLPTSTHAIRPTAILSPCGNQAISSSIVPIYENGRVYQLPLIAGRTGFSSDSKKVFLTASKGIYVLNADNAQILCIIPHEGIPARQITVSADGNLLASIDENGKIILRDANNGLIIRQMKAPLYQSQDFTSRVELSNDGSLLVSSGSFQPVTLWDTQSGRVILETIGDNAAISPDGKFLALRASNYTQIIDINYKHAQITKIDDKKETYFSLLFSRDGNYLYGLNVYSEIKVWDAHTGEVTQTVNPYPIQPCFDGPCVGWEVESPRMTMSADGSKLLLVDPSQIIVWNTQTWEKIMSQSDFGNHSLYDASIGPDGKKIIVTFAYETLIRFFYLDE